MRKQIYAGVYWDGTSLTDADGNPLRTSNRQHAPAPRTSSTNIASDFRPAEQAPKPEHFDKRFPHANYRIDQDTYWKDGVLYRRQK